MCQDCTQPTQETTNFLQISYNLGQQRLGPTFRLDILPNSRFLQVFLQAQRKD